MKNIKVTFLIGFLVAMALSSTAQLRTTTRSTIQQGQFLDYPGSWLTAVPAAAQMDTLQVSDTVAYIIPVMHSNDVDLTHEFYWTKYGSGTATVTLTFYQGNTPWYFTQCTSGVAKTAYSKSYTISASGDQGFLSFKTDSVNFTGRYLKVQYMTSSTASVGGKIISRTKATIK